MPDSLGITTTIFPSETREYRKVIGVTSLISYQGYTTNCCKRSIPGLKKNFQFIFQVLESFKYVWSPKDTTVTKYQVNSTGSPPEIIKLFELEGTLEGHLAQSPCKEQGEPHPASQCPQGLGIHYLSDQLTTLILKNYSFITNLNLTS